jgi:hypothetical protein
LDGLLKWKFYAALRFSNAKTNLGLNFMREIKRDVQIHLESRQY